MLWGKPKTSWTHLAEEATEGALSITVEEGEHWEPGDRIVVTSTGIGTEKDCTMARRDQCEAEDRVVTDVEALSDGKVRLTLDTKLVYTHLVETPRQAPGTNLEYARVAEVGSLTRNIVIEGVRTGFEERARCLDTDVGIGAKDVDGDGCYYCAWPCAAAVCHARRGPRLCAMPVCRAG